jgi:hypothetical protein
MQDLWARYPPFEQRNKSFPPFASPLTATCECLMPQSIDALPEGAQLSDVARHCVVLVIADDDFPKPCTGLGPAIMHAAAKFGLDGLQLRCHSRFRCDAPDCEGSGLEPQDSPRISHCLTALRGRSDCYIADQQHRVVDALRKEHLVLNSKCRNDSTSPTSVQPRPNSIGILPPNRKEP